MTLFNLSHDFSSSMDSSTSTHSAATSIPNQGQVIIQTDLDQVLSKLTALTELVHSTIADKNRPIVQVNPPSGQVLEPT